MWVIVDQTNIEYLLSDTSDTCPNTSDNQCRSFLCQTFWNGYKMADQVTDTPNWGEKHQVFTLWISYTKPRPGVICKWINWRYLSLHTDVLQCLPLSYISLNFSPIQLTSYLKVCLLWGPEIYIQGRDHWIERPMCCRPWLAFESNWSLARTVEGVKRAPPLWFI